MSGTGTLALDLRDVAKTYKGKVHALRGVDMRVHGGEVFGLLGPNGAGKSTLVKILMTVIRPTRCEGTLLGSPVGEKATLARVGYLPEHHKFPGYLTGAQVLDFYGAMAGVARGTRKRRIGELLDLVGMSDWGKKRVGGYSKGMRQRVGVAQALMNDPDLVLLDEPTDGVDPVGRRDIRDIVVRMKDRGKAVFINSHLLSELEQVCDRVAILVQGMVAQQGTIDELTKDQQRYEIEFASEDGARVAQMLDEMDANGLPDSRVEGSRIRLSTVDAVAVQPMIDGLRARGVTIRSIRAMRPSLEDLFMVAVTDRETGRTLAPGAAKGGR
ncbi:MAG: ABC transporter ATP-binding protein [Phycisphaeraceae bacterium]|nr:ABC transporter ATP-binding protein [Phycisphaerales bacterium]MCB9844125.1 ABC transporter ATP-binding protein [Phycisphaeraceae bacterium]